MGMAHKLKVGEHPRPNGWGSRHILALMLFLNNAICQSMRVNVSVAIVAMVKQGKLLSFKYENNNKTNS
jgi:hypothetical protein